MFTTKLTLFRSTVPTVFLMILGDSNLRLCSIFQRTQTTSLSTLIPKICFFLSAHINNHHLPKTYCLNVHRRHQIIKEVKTVQTHRQQTASPKLDVKDIQTIKISFLPGTVALGWRYISPSIWEAEKGTSDFQASLVYPCST